MVRPPRRPRARPWALALALACAVRLIVGGGPKLGPAFSNAPRSPQLSHRQTYASGSRGKISPASARTARRATDAAVEAAAAGALAAAPAISFVVGAALFTSVLQLSRATAVGAGGPPAEVGEGFFGPDRWPGRTIGIALVWATFIGYAFFLAPGQSPEAKEQDVQVLQTLLSTPFDGTVAPLFVSIFNSLGIWPVIYMATLLPGAARQSFPAWPFLGASVFLGAFGLSPYLALREYRVSADEEELDWPTRYWFEGRINAVLLLLSAVYLVLFAVGNGTVGSMAVGEAWSAFLPVFMGSLTPHVSCVDFLVLWSFYSPVLLEDGRRRGCFTGSFGDWEGSEKALFLACAGVPIFGGCTWLLLRPPLKKA